jgi:hypothetical protein
LVILSRGSAAYRKRRAWSDSLSAGDANHAKKRPRPGREPGPA